MLPDNLRDSLFKLFWTMANVALGAAAVELADWEQGIVTLLLIGAVQLASTFVRGKVGQQLSESRSAAREQWGRARLSFVTLLAAAALAVAMLLGSATPAAPAPVHTSSQCFNVGAWWEAYFFGGEPNNIARTANVPVAWWGSEQCWLRYSNGTGTIVLLYDVRSGASAWLDLNWSTVERDTPPASHL